MTEEIRTSVQVRRFCKRGHLKTEATTFERITTAKGKKYRVRECRACHALRNHPPGSGKTGRTNRSRWLDDKRASLVRWNGTPCTSQKQVAERIRNAVASQRLYEAIETYRDRHERGKA